MNVRDCALLLADDNLATISREEGHNRWSEQMQVADFHMKVAARAWIPTKVSLCVIVGGSMWSTSVIVMTTTY